MEQMNYTAPQPQPAPQPVYAQGCLSAAWADIKSTPGYVGKLAVLGLIMCVPILNFVVAGYLLHWAREVPFGGRTPLPAQRVTGKNFEFGFYAFVITLAVSIAVGVVGFILGVIPILGWLIYMALSLAAMAVIALMQMRMIMGYSIGDGFNVKDIWKVAQRNVGQLLLVTLVPGLVVSFAVGIVGGVIMFVAMMLGLGGAMPSIMASSYAGATSMADVLAIMGFILGPALFAGLVVYVLGMMAETAATTLTLRGLGHWVARYAPEWTALAPMVPPTQPVQPTPPVYPQTPGTPLQ